jgi:predicted dehydrogenase/threonine dehydrogenase-like Zn-dependent dehydrogenase
MKQVLENRRGLVVVRDVPEPHCPPGAVVVRNAFSAISSGTERSRVTEAQTSLISRARKRPELLREVARRASTEGVRKTSAAIQRKLAEENPVGYSSAGQVIRVGSAVRGLAPGDRVACAGAGFANHSEIVSVPANLCARVPEQVSLEHASLTTIAAIALHGTRLAGVALGERVAVIGCGLVGQIASRLLHAAGAEVYAIDIEAHAVDQALAGGADHGFTIDDGPAERIFEISSVGLDAVLVTAGASSNEPLLLAADILRDRGTLVLVGDVPVEFPRAPLYRKELTFRISRSYGPGRYDHEYEERGLDYPIGYVRWTQQRNMECVLDLQARGRLDLGPLIGEVVPVEDASRAYALLAEGSDDRPRGALLLSYPIAEDGAEPRQQLGSTVRPRKSVEGAPRIGLIGPGSFATNVLVPAFVEAGGRLELVGGGSGPSAEAAGRDLGFSRVGADASAVIDDPDVDVVVIATRHGSHAELTIRALEAGKHVFCEKPLALDETELEQVLEAAKRSERTLLVGFNRRFSPFLRELRAFLGDARFLASYRISAGSLPPSTWVHDLADGGGRIIGEACHFLDSLVFLAGAPIRTVTAAAVEDPSLPIQARDNVVVSATLESGSVGTISYVALGSAGLPKERLEVFSGERTAVLDDYRSLELYNKGNRTKQESRVQDKGHREEVRALLEGLRMGTAPMALDETANVSLAALAVVESLRTGAAVSVREL